LRREATEVRIKRASAIDCYVAQQMRQRRIVAERSQQEVGHTLGVTFQQIQKYESGANRISAGKLYLLADLFGVEVGTFFEGLKTSESAVEIDSANDNARRILAFAKTREGQDVLGAYLDASKQVRALALDLLKLGLSRMER
jgi:transcriptional regulator with XRE-family HTH domain